MVFNKRLFDAVEGSYVTGVTNSGHPLAMAACNAAMDAYENDNIGSRVGETAAYITAQLEDAAEQLGCIGEISGKGLMIGVDLIQRDKRRSPIVAEACAQVVSTALDAGLLVRGRGSRICISPPLNLDLKDADILCDRLISSIQAVV